MMELPLHEQKMHRQSLISVYFHSVIYYDAIYSFFLLIFQYFIFIYKYNILFYAAALEAGELVILTLLLALNALRLSLGSSGNRGKRYSHLIAFMILDIVLLVGYVYIVALQINALYLQVIMSIIGLAISGVALLLAIVLIIIYRLNE